MDKARKLIAGSDSVEDADREISLWFNPSELITFKSHSAAWVSEAAAE